MIRHALRALAALTGAGVLATALVAQQPAPAAPAAAQQTVPASAADTMLWAHIGGSARTRAAALLPTTSNENARVVAQYREALADLTRGAFSDAVLTLQAVVTRAPNNGLYRADFAYALARAGRFDDAGNAYTRAFQLQQQNAWFLAGIAATRAAQRQWADAAGTIQLAASTDSAVVSGPIPGAAAGWFEQAGDRNGALVWARIATGLNPDDAQSWLRIASYLRARGDSSPEVVAAIRHFRSLRPDDKLGAALYADYLYTAGQPDSALALITMAAQDSAYQEFAAQLYLQVGRDLFQRRDTERAIRLLTIGQQWATPAQRPAFDNIMGRSRLLQLNAALTALEEDRNCAAARAADSLAALTERNLRDGISFDSVRTQSVLDNILPQYKQNAANSVQHCSDTPARPAARPAPAPAPARPRPRP